jgi:ubiquitin carboxyl-terminal hydrolase 8
MALGGASHTRATSVNGGGPVFLNKATEGPKGGSRIFPHLDDLVNVRPDVNINAPIKTIILAGDKYTKQADSHLDFRRPDIALEEYIKASIIAVEIIPRHKDYPQTQIPGEPHRLYQGLKKRISKQDPKFFDVRSMIKEDNAKSGVRPLNTKSRSNNDAAIARNGISNGHNRTQSEATPSVFGEANVESEAETDSTYSRQKPVIHPKPQALHGKAVPSPTQTDLAARFARLRSPESKSPVQDPRIRTQPITLHEIPNYSPESRSSLSSSTLGTSTSSKPSGPREVPLGPNGHVVQPRIHVDVKIPTMPRAPDAIYSPARSTDSAATASLPSSVTRGASYTGHSRKSSAPPISSVGPTPSPVEPRQDYFVLSHSVNGHGSAQNPRSQDVFIPDSVYISVDDLFKFQRMGSQSVRILHVDLRSRDQFDAGHIMSQSIICIEPVTLRRGISGEEIADSMVVAPDAELALFNRRQTFDLVIFYDQSSTKVNPFNNSGNEMENSLHNFTSAVYDFGYEKRVKRRPMLLVGGLDAWVDLMGSHSLKTSNNGTLDSGTSTKLTKKAVGALSRVGAVRDPTRSITSRPPVQSRILTREEQNKWSETLNKDKVSGRPADADPETSDEFFYTKTTDDFFRRFPDISTIQESMVSNIQSPPPLHSYGTELSNTVPQPPTRPAPALPRQRSSGLSERGPTAVYAAGHSVNRSNNITEARVVHGLTGLYNPHNLCYMNSCLQALSATPMIREEMLRWHNRSSLSTGKIPRKDHEAVEPSQLLVKNLGVVMHHLWSGHYDWISPKTFAVSEILPDTIKYH